jgi:hypothetical protein
LPQPELPTASQDVYMVIDNRIKVVSSDEEDNVFDLT